MAAGRSPPSTRDSPALRACARRSIRSSPQRWSPPSRRPGPEARQCTAMAVPERAAARPSLTPGDLYEVDDLLSDDERLVRDSVRALVRERVLPVIGEHFEQGTFPRELLPALADMGLLGMHLHGYGCAGSSAIAYGVACEELEAGDSAVRSFISVQ